MASSMDIKNMLIHCCSSSRTSKNKIQVMCTGNPYKSDPCMSTSVYVGGGGHWTSMAVAYLDTYRRYCAASKKTGLQLLTSVLELFFCFDLCYSKRSSHVHSICLFYCKCHNHVTNILSLQVPTNLSEAYIAYYKVDNQTIRNLQAIQH